MSRLRRLGLLFGLAALIAVGAAGAVGAVTAGNSGNAVQTRPMSLEDTGCECEQSESCPAPTPTPDPTPEPVPDPTPSLRLASVNHRLAAAAVELVSVVDVDMTGFNNGQFISSLAPPLGVRDPRFKTVCPKDAIVFAEYTTNKFQGDLLVIEYFIPPLDATNCMVTIKVLDPATGRVLETYESPSNLILVKPDAIGFKHAPARIRVEVRCEK